MHLDPFAQGKSLWHRMDPRVKMVVAVLFALVTATADKIDANLFALAVACAALATARLRPALLARRMVVVNGFVLFVCAFLPFTAAGQALRRVGPLTVQKEGLVQAASILLRANAIAAATAPPSVNVSPPAAVGANR